MGNRRRDGGAFTRNDLKSGVGDSHWLRFFALMSTVIASQEGKPLVPNTPDSHDGIVQEIMECDHLLGGIETRLTAVVVQRLRHPK